MAPVAHLDLDAFYVSVELLRRPELVGKPVVVSGSGPRAVVTTASYEARAFGVGSAIPAARARRLCPQAVFITPDMAAYRSFSEQVMEIVRAQVESVEVAGLDEAYLDLEGLIAPRAAMRALVVRIRRQTGLGASVGIGPNKLVAKVASDAEKPAGFVVLTREQACARFATAAPSLLPGVGPRTAERLLALGIGTIAELGATSPEVLAERFGARLGPHLARRGRFEDDGAVQQVRAVVSESRETTFSTDISDPNELERILGDLAARLCADLGKRGRRGRTVAIKVRLDDFSTHTRSRTLPEAVDDPARVGGVALELLRDFGASRPVRLLGVRVAGLQEEAAREIGQMALPL